MLVKNKVSTLVINCDDCHSGDVNNRGNGMWGAWELSVLPLQCFYKSKTILKLKSVL